MQTLRQFFRWGSSGFRRKWTSLFSLASALIVIGFNFNIQALMWTRGVLMPNSPITFGLVIALGTILGAWWAWKMEY